MASRLLILLTLLALLSGCAPHALVKEVSFSPTVLSPNAKQAKLTFRLPRDAVVGIELRDAQGRAYTFRPPVPLHGRRLPYTVYFNGVVEAFSLPGDPTFPYTVRRRMLPDGRYTWRLTADRAGQRQVVSGTVRLQDADTTLPGIRGFSIYPRTFSPNQDGVADRVRINMELTKDVDSLVVYLQDADGTRRYIPEDEQVTKPNAAGWHTFDYDGGIDAGSEPPPDGTYTVYATAQDALGQVVMVSDTLTIVHAGLPMGYIQNGEVTYNTSVITLGQSLCFTLTVENDSRTPLRTTGPWPGTTYHSDENFNTLGWSEESGVFRVGLDFENSLRNYPYRWGIGRPGVDLVQEGRYWYLPPHHTAVVTGCLQVDALPPNSPLYYWTGLIHEDVAIARVNDHVAPHRVSVLAP